MRSKVRIERQKVTIMRKKIQVAKQLCEFREKQLKMWDLHLLYKFQFQGKMSELWNKVAVTFFIKATEVQDVNREKTFRVDK